MNKHKGARLTPYSRALLLKRMLGRLRAGGDMLLAEAALQGLGIVAEPEPLVFEGLRNGELVQLLPDWEVPPMNLWAVYPQRRHLPANVRRFIELLREHVQDPPYWERRA